MLAVAMEDYQTGEIKKDPKYVKWIAEYVVIDNGVKTQSEVPMHECSEKDYAKFYEPNDGSLSKLEFERIKEKGGIMCIDWQRDNVVLQGNTGSAKYSFIDITMVPCSMRETNIGGTEDRIPEDCNYNK